MNHDEIIKTQFAQALKEHDSELINTTIDKIKLFRDTESRKIHGLCWEDEDDFIESLRPAGAERP